MPRGGLEVSWEGSLSGNGESGIQAPGIVLQSLRGPKVVLVTMTDSWALRELKEGGFRACHTSFKTR